MKEVYIVIRKVIRATGRQTFTVEAESYEEAAKTVMNGGGTFDDEEIEVSELSDSCHVYRPDDRVETFIDEFGKIRPPNPQSSAGGEAAPMHGVVGPLSDTEQ